MYVMLENVYLIMRSDYNWDMKCFTTPYVVAGSYKKKAGLMVWAVMFVLINQGKAAL